MADNPLHLDASEWMNRPPGKHAAYEAFYQASLASEVREQQEFDRRFHTPEARAKATDVKADISDLLEANTEALKTRIKEIDDWHDWKYQSPEFNKWSNEMRAKAYEDWGKARDRLHLTRDQQYSDIELEQVKLKQTIGPIGKDRQLEDQRSDHKKAWDDAGSRTEPWQKRSEVQSVNAASGGAPL